MTVLSIATLFILMLALAAMPSASVALVVVRSATHGVSHGVAVTAGIVAGDWVFVTLAMVGMSALSEALGAFFGILRVAGGAYLIWMGLDLLRSKGNRLGFTADSQRSTWVASFLAGLALTLGDVKAILFYASLFPAFVDMAGLSARDGLVIFTVTAAAVGGVKLTYAFAARWLVERFEGFSKAGAVRKVAGGLMIGAGSYLITKT